MRNCITPIAAASIATVLAGAAHGAGFYVAEQSVKGLGTAFSGGAAAPDDRDPSVGFYNPAGLTRLDDSRSRGHAAAAGYVIVPLFEYEDQGSTNAFGGPPDPTSRFDDDGGTLNLAGNLHLAGRLGNGVSAGLGITVPFGLKSAYEPDWVGRYHAIDSELITININPSVAFEVTEDLSVGAGFSAQYIDATLTNALDFGAAGAALMIPGVTPSTRAFDGESELTADDWGYGFNLGALYEFTERTRAGVGYRSKISHELEGESEVTLPEGALGMALADRVTERQGARARVDIPELLFIGGYHQINDDWAITADATWTHWSRIQELVIELEDGGESTLGFEFKNTWRFGLGTIYRPRGDRWTFRAGIAYDETPVPNAEARSPRLPDDDRWWFGLGASYRHGNWTVDLGYAFLYVGDVPIDNREETTGGLTGADLGSRLTGEYDSTNHVVGIQASLAF